MSVTLLFMMGSLIMLVPFANLNIFSNTAMAQWYDNYGDSSRYSKYPTEDNKYECRTGPLEGFFVSSVEFCNLNSMIEKITIEIIEQEHKAHLVHKEFRVYKVQLVLMVYKAHLDKRIQVY